MSHTLRDAWKAHIRPEHYEAHMAAIGQARANAGHLLHLLQHHPPPPGATLWLAGSGPGQMFDYLPAVQLSPWRLLCTDISHEFLTVLRRRCPHAECVVEDLYQPAVACPVHTAVLALVLEHLDWRRGVKALASRHPEQVLIVIQQNPDGMASAVTPSRELPGTMGIFEQTHPCLLGEEELIDAMRTEGYSLTTRRPSPVADGKTMLAVLFSKGLDNI